jgi:hypothetical protein
MALSEQSADLVLNYNSWLTVPAGCIPLSQPAVDRAGALRGEM